MIPASLLPYRVTPATPKQVFAGVPPEATLFLAFPDAQTAIAALTEAGLCKDDGKGGTHFAPNVDFIGGGQREIRKTDGAEWTKNHAGVLVNVVGLIDPPVDEAKA